jgi:predicted glycoside hydrolase/deacetylase ChbG (UPF0249 family)
MSRRLIINADDFGVSQGVTDSIVRLTQQGIVTSTTLMATGRAFDYAVRCTKEMHSLSVGVHLDATSGSPVSPVDQIESLVDEAGQFLPKSDLGALSRINPVELQYEFKNQIEKALAAGIDVSHLDNHHNWVYFDSRLFEVVVSLAAEYQLPIRYPFSGMSEHRARRIATKLGLPTEKFFNSIQETSELVSHHGVKKADSFWIEFTSFDRTEQAFEEFVRTLEPGTTELCVHPGSDTDRQKTELNILSKYGPAALSKLCPDLELVSFRSIGS